MILMGKIQLKQFLIPIAIITVYLVVSSFFLPNIILCIFSIISIFLTIYVAARLNKTFKEEKGLSLKNNILMGALDSSLFALIVFDKNFKCVFINDLAALLFQNKPIKTYDDIVRHLRPEEHVKNALTILKDGANSPKPNYVDISILDVEYVWWRISLSGLKGDSDLSLLTITDITPSLKYMKDFDNNPSFLKNCINLSPIGIFGVNKENEIVFCNENILQTFETTREKLIYTKADQLIKDSRPLPNTNQDSKILHASITKDGTQKHLLINKMFERDSVAVYAMSDERRNSSILQALDVSKTYFDYIFEDAPLGIVVTDGAEIISASNNTFKKLVGSQAVEGKSILSFVDQAYEEELRQELYKITTSQNYKPDHTEVSLRIDRQNTVVMYLDRLKSGFGNASSVIIYLLDISEFKELESQIIQSQKMQAIGQLAGGIAHDFNNLLTAMIGYSDLLLSRCSPADASFNDIMQIKQNANRASNLVKQLLAFSRQQTLQPRIIDITEALEEISLLLQRLIGPQIALNVSYCKDPYLIKVDEIQMEQVIINLAVNARDAMCNEGTLTIRTTNVDIKEEQKIIDITLFPGSYLMLEIIDTGKGIPNEYRDRIFDPFFSTKEKGQGTGLGLATVYGIIRQTGGNITFESTLNQGTNFKIFFPKYERENKSATHTEQTEKKKYSQDLTGTGTILLVEDEDAVRMFSSRALKEKGYKILEASGGEEALEIVKSSEIPIDLIITDVIMPNMDGVEFVQKIRESSKNVKVIFISGYTEDKFKNILEQDDVTYFLPKPFTLKDLAGKVKEVL